MAVRQINTADYDYSMFLETLNKSYKGKSDITIDEYDTDAAPDVKIGSVWEDNGAIFILESADMTPTGYAGIANSTTFYLYYDESGEVFIYSSTVPVWSDAKQGWYNSNDRAFFSMYKDSGGTLYENKRKFENQLQHPINLSTKIIEIGDWDMDANGTKTVTHGFSDYKKVRVMSGIIRNDVDSTYYPLVPAGGYGTVSPTPPVSINNIQSTSISLFRLPSSIFDSTSFNSTSFNRGWITITYEE